MNQCIINGNTIFLFFNGQSYYKVASDDEVYQATTHALAKEYEEILDLCFPTKDILLKKEGFWEDDGSLYYKNIKVSIPKVLANKFLAADEEEFNRLIKFWSWLSLNPNPRTRENLYGWVEKNGIQLTNGGLMILYRRVVSVKQEKTELGKYVKETYEKLRKMKRRTNINVWTDGEGYYISDVDYGDNLIGNLYFLYHNPNTPTQVFTDARTGTKRYIIGEEAREPRSAGDESDRGCSTGLHCAAINYDYSDFGDTPIVVVVNACDVLNAVDNFSKIRTCAFTPIAVLNKDCEWIDDPKVHERIDACYDQAVERLESLLEQATFEDFKQHEVLSNEWNLQVGFETVLKILN